jgi:mono/diheme cytochrome c family protein
MKRFVLLASLMAALVGWAASAQPAAPAPDEPPACDDPVRLSAQVAEAYLALIDLRPRLDAQDPTALADLYRAGQRYQDIALTCGYLPDNLNALLINSTDLDRILPALETLSGDPLRGQLLYDGQEPTASGDVLGCAGCHAAGLVAPLTEGTWTRWDEQRRLEPRFEGYDFARYVAESVLLPWDYFVEGYPEYTMPDFYAKQLSYQDLLDLITYLESQDQLP